MLMQAFSSYACFVCLAFVLLSHNAKSCSPTCGLLGWTQWSPCTPMGEQSRDAKLCCPTNLAIYTLEECLRVCNLTMDMAVSKQSCTYTPTTHAAISGLVKFYRKREFNDKSSHDNWYIRFFYRCGKRNPDDRVLCINKRARIWKINKWWSLWQHHLF